MNTHNQPQQRRLSAQARRAIDDNIKRVYDDALEEDLPERFKQLIAQLANADNAQPSGEDAQDTDDRQDV